MDGAGTLLALDRVVQNNVVNSRIYELDVPQVGSTAPSPDRPSLVSKRLLVDFNVDGLHAAISRDSRWDRRCRTGGKQLVVVADNLSGQTVGPVTQINAFAIDVSPT